MMTFIETLQHLKSIGYGEDLAQYFREHQDQVPLQPGDYNIDEAYRIDEFTDPEEQVVIYAISSVDKTLKGFVSNGFGIYSDPWANQLLEKLPLNEEHYQTPLRSELPQAPEPQARQSSEPRSR